MPSLLRARGPSSRFRKRSTTTNAVDLCYLDLLESGDLGRSVFDGPDIDDPSLLGQKQYEADLRFTTLCGKIADNLVAEMQVTERESGSVEEAVVALLPHLVQHQTHHCG